MLCYKCEDVNNNNVPNETTMRFCGHFDTFVLLQITQLCEF